MKMPRKMAIPYNGRRNTANSTSPIWVLGPKLFLDNRGHVLDVDSCNLVWIGHLVSAPKAAADSYQLLVFRPLSVDSLNKLLVTLHVIMHYNFYPSMIALGDTAMALHHHSFPSCHGDSEEQPTLVRSC